MTGLALAIALEAARTVGIRQGAIRAAQELGVTELQAALNLRTVQAHALVDAAAQIAENRAARRAVVITKLASVRV